MAWYLHAVVCTVYIGVLLLLYVRRGNQNRITKTRNASSSSSSHFTLMEWHSTVVVAAERGEDHKQEKRLFSPKREENCAQPDESLPVWAGKKGE